MTFYVMGVIESLGERRRSRIAQGSAAKRAGLHVCVLLYERSDLHEEHTVDLKHRLVQRGHRVTLVDKTLSDLRFDLGKVIRIVEKAGGDAWIILAGSRPVLEWFAEQPMPAFAMFGRHMNVPIAGLTIHKAPAIAVALERLVALGHRRIVLLAREERRKPTPAQTEQRFLNELERLGLEVGPYNLPDWENDKQSFHRCLDSLFQFTPPTAIFPGDSALFFATQQYLLGKRISVPGDVSLVALDDHPAFEWFVPRVSHSLLLGTYSQGWTRVRQRRGHVFQGRYKPVPVNGGESGAYDFRIAADYIHLNPARAGLAGGDRGRLVDFGKTGDGASGIGEPSDRGDFEET